MERKKTMNNIEKIDYKAIKKIISQSMPTLYEATEQDREDAHQQGFMEYLDSPKLQNLFKQGKLDQLKEKLKELINKWYAPEKKFKDMILKDVAFDYILSDQENHKRRLNDGEIFMETDPIDGEIYEKI
jgi:ABC-type proline/glycine betaine transport system substrate-binding protein